MTDQERPARGMSGWLKLLLAVSLAFNLLIVGIVAGAMLSGGPWHPPAEMRPDAAIGPLTRALSERDRRAIGRRIAAAWRSGALKREDHRAVLQGLIADLTATPYDPRAVEARLAALGAIIDARIELGLKLLSERLAQMDAAERAAFAARLRRELRHRP